MTSDVDLIHEDADSDGSASVHDIQGRCGGIHDAATCAPLRSSA